MVINAGKMTRLDPSRTITLRRQFERDLGRRFNLLWQAIQSLLIEEDVFGLRSRLVVHEENEKGKWITVKGNHVFIPDGKDPGEAIKEHFESKKTTRESEDDEKVNHDVGVITAGVDFSQLSFKTRWMDKLSQKPLSRAERDKLDTLKVIGPEDLSKKDRDLYLALSSRLNRKLPLTSVVDHPTLFSKYPELAKYSVSLASGGYIASHSSYDMLIELPPYDSDKWKGYAVHEIVHAIQDIHGMPGGKSTYSNSTYDEYYNSVGERVAREIQSISHKDDDEKATKGPKNLVGKSPADSRSTPGPELLKKPLKRTPKISMEGAPHKLSYEQGTRKAVGEFDTSAGKRHSAADVSIDPETKETVAAALKKLKSQLASSGKGQVHNTRWQFHSTEQRLNAFQQWLKQQVAKHLLSEHKKEDEWLDSYIAQGFLRGAGRAFDDTRAPVRVMLERDPGRVSDFYRGTKEEFLRSSFAHPVSREKVRILAARTFTDLKGITDSMAAKVSRTLLDGLVQGDNPRVIASRLFKDLNISKARAQTIARTEIIRTHAEGQLEAFKRLGVEEIGVMVEWQTSGLGKTKKGNLSPCKLCRKVNGVVLTVEEATGLIPRHPNCMCAFVPANVGESKKNQKRSSSAIAQAFDRSYAAETTRSKTLMEVKRSSRWAADDKTIRRDRPRSIL
jgi:SPP1 gp7 family putative phage head morphogenesis protein